VLIAHTQVPRRSVHTLEGRAALVHAICHIEFNAINLALDAIWRFAGLPEAYYRDWLRVAVEEARHFGLLHAHLQTLGHRYGDFAAHDGLWSMCERTQGDVTARMALVPRTLEARGLDATPPIQQKLRAVGTPDALAACAILDIILRDEIGHVAIGNHWYRWLCEQQDLEPLAHYAQLTATHQAPRLKARSTHRHAGRPASRPRKWRPGTTQPTHRTGEGPGPGAFRPRSPACETTRWCRPGRPAG
jgi:uncharacterized ferritin-like protein (DUF455 family)